MSRLERFIEYVSPEWAAKRVFAREALSQARLSGYGDAVQRRIDKTIVNRGSSADRALELGFDRRNIADRARQAEQDNLLFDSLLSRTVESVVGESGFGVLPQTESPYFNDKTKDLFDAWATDEADARGIDDLAEIMGNLLRGTLRDGDAGLIGLADGSIRQFESDELASPKGGRVTPSDADGVELSPSGRPIAFHIFDYDPLIDWSDRRVAVPSRSTRVPAENVCFLARRQRAGQTRGVSAGNGALWLFEQFDGTVEAKTIATRMAACWGLFLKRQNPLTNLGTGTDGAGNLRGTIQAEPGMVLRGQPGDEAVQIQPQHIGNDYDIHLRLLVRLCAIRFGLPLELALLDFSQSNYSNARAVLLQSQKTWRKWQHRLKRIYRRLYHWKVISWIEEGRLPAREDALRHKWETPGWQWLDPVAEIQGAMAEVDAGLASRSSICARMGGNFADNMAAQKLELELMAEAGVPALRGTLSRDPVAPASPKSDPVKLPVLAR